MDYFLHNKNVSGKNAQAGHMSPRFLRETDEGG